MNSLASTNSILHQLGNHVPQNKSVPSAYYQYARTTELMKLICHLTRSMQIHRGMTMGWLSGQTAFHPQIVEQQQVIDRLFMIIQGVDWPDDIAISQNELMRLKSDWQVILNGWSNDQPMHNFEFHSHLIDTLLRILRVDLRAVLVRTFRDCNVEPPQLLVLCTELLPEVTEILAKLRGIATNVAVHKYCDLASKERLRFLCREAKTRHREIYTIAQSNEAKIMMPDSSDWRLEQYLDVINRELLNTETVVITSTEFFSHASQFIDELWNAIDHNILFLEQTLSSALLICHQ